MIPSRIEVIEALAVAENGAVGVNTPAGRIDVVTAAYAIQVEAAFNWRAAIAAAVEQAPFLPGLNPRAHLFGPAGAVDQPAVEATASAVGVAITWEVV